MHKLKGAILTPYAVTFYSVEFNKSNQKFFCCCRCDVSYSFIVAVVIVIVVLVPQ